MAKRATFKPYFKNSVVQQNKGDCKDEDKRAVAAWLRKTFFLFFFTCSTTRRDFPTDIYINDLLKTF